MKNSIKKRFFALFLTVSVSISMSVGISPLGLASNDVINSAASFGAIFKDTVNSVVGVGVVAIDVLEEAANMVSFRFSLDRTDMVSPTDLVGYVDEFNSLSWFHAALATNNSLRSVYEQAKANLANSQAGRPKALIRPDPTTGNNTVRPYIDGYGWLVDSNGHYPYCDRAEYNAFFGSGVPSTPKPFDGRWLSTDSIRSSKKVSQKSYADLDATKADLANKHPTSSVTISTLKVGTLTCKVIRRLEEGPGNRDWVWCDPNGLPYVYVDPDTQGAAQKWDYTEIQETTNNIAGDTQEIKEDIKQLIEINNDNGETSVNVPVQIGPNEWSLLKMDVDNIVIDLSDDGVTYTVDSHNVTYNTTNNYYEYNYYTYNIQYTYNNTYVTYIGSTAEYQPKEWALYYELPDGRSSADLTEEDIAGLSFQFADMVNYKRSATDTSLRALYHFDGNVDDASYWSGAHVWGSGGSGGSDTDRGYLQWNKGASITYMESNAFNGALYLDEKEHQFTIKLPSNVGSKDFSLQWRYYQNSATTTDHNENYVSIGGRKLLGWSEQSLYSLGTTKLSTGLSVGTWQELALVRDGTTLYIYHNGVCVGSAAFSAALNNQVVFYLGANSRAYSMLDELRFVNFSIAKRGSSYAPTAVPYDTNNVLVLPGGSQPVADEYWSFNKTGNLLLSGCDFVNNVSHPGWRYDGTYTGLQYLDGALLTGKNSSYSVSNGQVVLPGSRAFTVSGHDAPYPIRGLSTYLGGFSGSIKSGEISSSYPGEIYTVVPGQRYTFSVLGSDGKLYSLSFTASLDKSMNYDSEGLVVLASVSFNWGYLAFLRKTVNAGFVFNNDFSFAIFPKYNSTLSFVYAELVKGSQANTGHEFVTAICSSDDIQPNTAAIQSMIPVKGYTVGGVRPTFPKRGDVWMPVEGSRISGVYIYNGQAWEETNARYWTGKRWIPIYAFDLVTLADMWDVGSSTGGDVTPTITTEHGFWNWWKNQWLDFRQWLASLFGSGGITISPGTGSSGSEGKGFFEKILDALADGISTLIKGLFDVITEIFKTILSAVTGLLSSLFSFITDTVLGGITSFFSFFTDGSLFDFFRPDADSDIVALPEGIATVFSVFAGIVMLLPWELRSLLIFGIAVLILLSVLKFIKS